MKNTERRNRESGYIYDINHGGEKKGVICVTVPIKNENNNIDGRCIKNTYTESNVSASHTNLHLVHDGVGAQDVVLLLRVALRVLHGPGGLSTSREADHHQDLTQVGEWGKNWIIV